MDMFLLAGQSNMAGRGNVAELPERYYPAEGNQGVFPSSPRLLVLFSSLLFVPPPVRLF